MFEVVATELPGCRLLQPRVMRDARGTFVKTFHRDIFAEHGMATGFAETYYSASRQGVLRGLHFQLPPHDHAKLVYCIRGTVFDAVVDLRRGSPTEGGHATFELSAESGLALYIPSGFAHGFYVPAGEAIMMYHVTTVYAPQADTGILWNSAGIPWPAHTPLLSGRDRSFPALEAFESPFTFVDERE